MKRLLSILIALGCAPSPALASKPRLRLERLDPSALSDGKLRAYASVIELEGNVVEGLDASHFSLLVDGKPAGHALTSQRFAQLNEEVDVAFVVEVAAQYGKALDPVKEALRDFLADQPRQFKAMLVTYGSETGPPGRLQPAAALADPIDDLAIDEDSGDVKMVEAVQVAMTELNRIQPRPGQAPPRRLIVLISDGLNARMDRQTFRQLGALARKNHLPIHSLAYSPGDERGPLLNLGELSKLSNGTFRWAQTQPDLKAQLATLADEVRKQYVLTFDAPSGDLAKHLLQLRMDNLYSNRMRGTESPDGEGGVLAGGRYWRWWMWILVGLVGLVALYVLGLWLQSRGVAPVAATPPKPRAPRPDTGKAARAPAARPVSGAVAGVGAGGGARRAPARAELIAIGGAQAGGRFAVRAGLVAGKAAQPITISDDPTVSSRHCEFGSDDSGPFVRDLGSTNGTFVNNQRVAGLRRLADGDIVRLGANTQFKVRVD